MDPMPDHYTTLGVTRVSTPDEIKRAYRKLARKYHPDVSKEPDAEARFKQVAEAYEALSDGERRAAYDEAATRPRRRPGFTPPSARRRGFAANGDTDDHNAFFESLFRNAPGEDQHASLLIDLEDAYRGARRTLSLRLPAVDAQGRRTLQDRQLDVSIPKGVQAGQRLRLAGQGGRGGPDGTPGDLYLEIAFRPHAGFRVDQRDVHVALPIAPWEAALGAVVPVDTPDGEVQLSIPPGSAAGRKLRLRGRGLPSEPPGDLYATLSLRTPPADTDAQKTAYAALASAFPDFRPRP